MGVDPSHGRSSKKVRSSWIGQTTRAGRLEPNVSEAFAARACRGAFRTSSAVHATPWAALPRRSGASRGRRRSGLRGLARRTSRSWTSACSPCENAQSGVAAVAVATFWLARFARPQALACVSDCACTPSACHSRATIASTRLHSRRDPAHRPPVTRLRFGPTPLLMRMRNICEHVWVPFSGLCALGRQTRVAIDLSRIRRLGNAQSDRPTSQIGRFCGAWRAFASPAICPAESRLQSVRQSRPRGFGLLSVPIGSVGGSPPTGSTSILGLATEHLLSYNLA